MAVTDGRDACVYVYDFLNRTVGINDTATDGCVDPNAPAGDEGTYTLFVHDPLGRQIVQVTAPSVTGADDPDTGLAGSLVGVVDSGWDTTAGSFTTVPVGVVVDARVYDHDGGVEATVHTRDEVIETSAYGANHRLLASTKTGSSVNAAKVQVLNTDGHGNIVEVATITGGSGSCYRFYDPFGGVHPDLAGGSVCTEALTSNRLWYRGGQQSSVDGTYTFGSRHYSPASGTWTTPDTARPGAPLTDLSIGTDPLTANRYSYVNGDPINMIDPTGHEGEWAAETWSGLGEALVMEDDLDSSFVGRSTAGGEGIYVFQGVDLVGSDGTRACGVGESLNSGFESADQHCLTARRDLRRKFGFEPSFSPYGGSAIAPTGGLADALGAGFGGNEANLIAETLLPMDCYRVAKGATGMWDIGGCILDVIPVLGKLDAAIDAARTGRNASRHIPAADVVVIGKVDDLYSYTLRTGERTLLSQLPDQGSPLLNYQQNDRLLRTEIGRGVPIRDVSVDPVTGALRDNTGFLRAERDILTNHGWMFDPKSGYWNPPE